jgi:two-component system NtrC family sensor kinase
MFGLLEILYGFDGSSGTALPRLHLVSQSLIALASLLASAALLRIVRSRRGFRFNTTLFYLAASMMACGLTYGMYLVTRWYPALWVNVAIEAAAATALILVLLLLLRITPNILMVPDKLADSRFRVLIEEAPYAILQVDERGTIVIANRTAERMFGYTRDELLGSNVDQLVPQSHRAVHAKQRDLFLLARLPRLMGERIENLRARRNDGTEFPAEIGLSPVKTDAGMFVTAVIRDVTDRKRLERELEQERDTRGQRVEVLARLAADLAHEIKNPLAIIHARASDLSELAAQGLALPAPVVEQACDSILKTTARALHVIRGVQALAREGSQDPMQRTDLHGLIDQAVEMLQTRFETHGIELETVVPAGLPLLECREVQIEQVLVNLLNNAFDAIDGDPRSRPWVQVRVSLQPPSQQNSSAQSVSIEVLDGGPGVSPENRARLMETFFTTKPKGAGMGIGLSVSRTIALDHGGNLELLDSDGPTCFRLTLPLLARRPEEPPHEDR